MATHSNRKKISQLFFPQGECLIDNGAKIDALWESFKERLRVSEFSKIHFLAGGPFFNMLICPPWIPTFHKKRLTQLSVACPLTMPLDLMALMDFL
jgi:hypothetical protein